MLFFKRKMKMTIFFAFVPVKLFCGTHNICLRINEMIRFLNLPSYLEDYIIFGACLICAFSLLEQMSCNIRFPTMWYLRLAKPQISPYIHAV